MNISLIQMFFFVLILVVIMAGVAFIMGQKKEQILFESGIWAGSLIACAGGDYLLIVLNSNHAWT